jgi:hypothetical protein
MDTSPFPSNEQDLLASDHALPSTPIPIWKIMLTMTGLVVFVLAGSAIICGTDDKCRNHVPTVQNMLNSTLSTPFFITGVNVALGAHFIIAVSITYVTKARAMYWGVLQMTSAIVIYFCCIATLFVMPFVGWQNNWTNVTILIAIALWMVLSQISLRRGLRNTIRWGFNIMYLYIVCVIPYIVVRAIPDLPIQGKDAGLLVCEIVGALSFVMYMCVCLAHVYNVSIRLYHPERKAD